MTEAVPSAQPATPETFRFVAQRFDDEAGRVFLDYAFDNGATFTETIDFGTALPDRDSPARRAFDAAIRSLFVMAGVSYYKVWLPPVLDLNRLPLAKDEIAFFAEVYREGLGEFAMRNGLSLDGRLQFENAGAPDAEPAAAVDLPDRSAVLIGGGKDSLVSLEILRASGEDIELFCVNPREPMIDSAEASGVPMATVKRSLDPYLFELNARCSVYNGHVPITAIVSLIAVAAAFVHGWSNIVLSNERSADEPTVDDVNHQYSKSSAFEARFVEHVAMHISPSLNYFSLLRPLSELHIAQLFAKTDRYDRVFTSCNKAFRILERTGERWCLDCAKCRFTFLMMATVMPPERLIGVFGANLLDMPEQLGGYEELTALDGAHKPWDCVGEFLESRAALMRVADHPDWRDTAIVLALAPRIAATPPDAAAAYDDFLTPQWQGRVPARFRKAVDGYL